MANLNRMATVVMMKHTQSEIEAKAKGLYGSGYNYLTHEDQPFDSLSNSMKKSWMRSAAYYLRKEDVENTVDSAVENEASTKGWMSAHQGAWDMAGFYAEEAGVSVKAFRKNMLKRHRRQFTNGVK